jgi:L-fuculose-phosphate aldolase
VASRVGKKAAVLMANHGVCAVGRNPQDVLHVAALVERTAEIVWGARALGTVVPLPDAVNKQFSGYYRYGRTGSFD